MGHPPDQQAREESVPDVPGPDVLGAWMIEFGPALRQYFRKKVSAQEADDLVQDVFVAMQARGSLTTIENVQGYLFRVAANVLARRDRGADAFDPMLETQEPVDELSPERMLSGREDLARLVVAIDGLTPRCRTAFMLHRFEDMTYRTIAEHMNIGVDAVKQLIHRAMVRLAEDMRQSP